MHVPVNTHIPDLGTCMLEECQELWNECIQRPTESITV